MQKNQFDGGSVFFSWLDTKTDFQHIIIVLGNHDGNYERINAKVRRRNTVHLLFDEELIIDGVKFYGTPWTKQFFDWHWGKSEDELVEVFAKIPDDVNVLISHSPPFGMMDYVDGRHEGSVALKDRIAELKELKLHVFGHLHDNGGVVDNGEYLSVNASLLDENYYMAKKPVEAEI